ncbi:related to serine-type carboxypeptidase Z precursor [Cephalotrichum gorgonifer]|uniref:Related to serine-type carboxypeptidase Z n=1 Tax=Cephalotrichum gorgonifer TaxID=2041049 RepID=A0AAE8N2Z7_9PEZI|nr:related to serine-type carboxypeptidase Z precursor [Cephalotrichum gorgonifer]
MARPSIILGLSALATAQMFLPTPKETIQVPSERYPGASISYKQTQICETTPGVNAYSGYVSLPSEFFTGLQDPEHPFGINTFFWYFESRNNPKDAPTSIYLAGGPGTSSLDGASGFPCLVNPDSNSTTLNEFSWNNNVNMLYIDQPVGVGYSYTTVTKGVVDLLTDTFTPLEDPESIPELNLTTVQASKSTPDPHFVVNNTETAAKMMWRFAQVWFQEFPEYKTSNDEISVWATSYGGFWGPGFLSYFLTQNEDIAAGTNPDKNAVSLNLSTLGLGNGCIDSFVQGPGFPEFAINNTYGYKAYSDDVYEMAMGNLTAPGTGCLDLIKACRETAAANDPESIGADAATNEACIAATAVCWGVVQGAYTTVSDRSAFDISLVNPAVYPPEYHIAFFNQRWVQEELGVHVNYTIADPNIVNAFFLGTGDPMRRDITSLEHVLDSGLSVAMFYGDLDYRCNWFGVEDVSLQMEYPDAPAFRSAGYTPIQASETYEGGLVRQHGNVSFSRVYGAGHSAASYQQETVFRIFDRVMSGKDVGTGEVEASEDYSSEGPSTVFDVRHELPKSRKPICYLYDIALTCNPKQIQSLIDGTAIVKDFIVVDKPCKV